MTNALIAYGTAEGQTARISEYIARIILGTGIMKPIVKRMPKSYQARAR